MKKMQDTRSKEKFLYEYARSLIEASLDPLVTISTEGKIMDANEAMLDVIDKTRSQLIGTDFENYFTDAQKALEVYQEVFEKGFVINYPLSLKDGKITDVLFNGSVYKDADGNVLGAVVVARNIMEQKRIEADLVQSLKEISDYKYAQLTAAKVFAELTTTIAEEAKIKAENALKSKQQFLSNMSHEIRTPMNAIIGFTKVLLKTELTAKQKEYLTAIKMSGDALIVLINDILDLAKVDAGKMTFEKIPFRLASSVSAMLNVFETKIQEKNLKLYSEYDKRIPEVLLGDPVRLHQIILNLVSNAVKFTTKGAITMSVRMLHENETRVSVEFMVMDTGIGISADKMETIFENFQQASSETSRLFGGTGLGLAISKQLVEQQGGTIKVQSKINEGSTFSFVLDFPKTETKADFEIKLEELDPEIKNIKVLVVEDMALNQLLMKTILDDFGFDRDIADNGKVAIEKLQFKSYDIILMDLQMPEMNGFEATEYIRTVLNSKVPIIALTADVTTVDVAKCKIAGMNDYIAKPIDEKLLFNKIINLVKKNPTEAEAKSATTEQAKRTRYTDLNYLSTRTKSNPVLMTEMISIYLDQTPALINTMKQSLANNDWATLQASVHKIIPSFSIMGISTDFELLAKKIQEYASAQIQLENIHDLVFQIETVCTHACQELQEELNILKNKNL